MSLSEKAASRLVLTSASWGLNDGAFVPSARAAPRESALRDILAVHGSAATQRVERALRAMLGLSANSGAQQRNRTEQL